MKKKRKPTRAGHPVPFVEYADEDLMEPLEELSPLCCTFKVKRDAFAFDAAQCKRCGMRADDAIHSERLKRAVLTINKLKKQIRLLERHLAESRRRELTINPNYRPLTQWERP